MASSISEITKLIAWSRSLVSCDGQFAFETQKPRSLGRAAPIQCICIFNSAFSPHFQLGANKSVAFLPCGHPLASRKELRLAELKSEAFLLGPDEHVPG